MNKKDEDKVMSQLVMPNDSISKERRLGINRLAVNLVEEHLANLFLDEGNLDRFDKCYKEAISGSGDELFKMDAPWSSSLCALLFFYPISEKNYLEIGGIKYIESYFEVKSEVYNAPSNMDVVLRSENNDLLFIECKFTEYLTPSTSNISPKYLEDVLFFSLVNGDGCLKVRNTGKNKRIYQAYYNDREIYTEGIKQIIAHLIGLRNFQKGINSQHRYSKDNEYEDRRYEFYNIKYNKARFMEVVFKFNDGFDDIYNRYHDAVTHLLNKSKGVTYLAPTTYQAIYKNNTHYKLDSKVISFYRYER